MGCTGSSVEHSEQVEVVSGDARLARKLRAVRRAKEALASHFGHTDSLKMDQQEEEGRLTLGLSASSATKCCEAFARIEAACQRQDLALTAARLEVGEDGKAHLTLEVDSHFGEPAKCYEVPVPATTPRTPSPRKSFQETGSILDVPLRVPADPRALLCLNLRGKCVPEMFKAVGAIAADHKCTLVQGDYFKDSRAPNTATTAVFWFHHEGGLIEDGQRLISSIGEAFYESEVSVKGAATSMDSESTASWSRQTSVVSSVCEGDEVVLHSW